MELCCEKRGEHLGEKFFDMPQSAQQLWGKAIAATWKEVMDEACLKVALDHLGEKKTGNWNVMFRRLKLKLKSNGLWREEEAEAPGVAGKAFGEAVAMADALDRVTPAIEVTFVDGSALSELVKALLTKAEALAGGGAGGWSEAVLKSGQGTLEALVVRVGGCFTYVYKIKVVNVDGDEKTNEEEEGDGDQDEAVAEEVAKFEAELAAEAEKKRREVAGKKKGRKTPESPGAPANESRMERLKRMRNESKPQRARRVKARMAELVAEEKAAGKGERKNEDVDALDAATGRGMGRPETR